MADEGGHQGNAPDSEYNHNVFGNDPSLYEELDPESSETLGAFKITNPDADQFQRPMILVSPKESNFKKTVELVLCIHGWEDPSKKVPMTLVVLGVNLFSHARDFRIQSVRIWLSFEAENTENPSYAASVGVSYVANVEGTASREDTVSYTRRHFDKGPAQRTYDERAGRVHGVEWYYEQNSVQRYGVKPNFHVAALVKRSPQEGPESSTFTANFDMQVKAGLMHDFNEGHRRIFRLEWPEDDPLFFDPERILMVNGVDGTGRALLTRIQIDNLGALAEGEMMSKLVDFASG
ncbi:hypothetical protein SLS57_011608, partial [Botryosphaeria dothidea]